MEGKLKILAVDDNSISLAKIEQELKGEYEVTPVNSGERALKYLKKNRPNLILLDVQMALKDGVETLREIREMKNSSDIPVIMLTSQRDRQTSEDSSKQGLNGYVVKPFNADDLRERIERVLKKDEAFFGELCLNSSRE